ncbi:hypothetical protein C2I18_06040 [Paenibacillus sp. PK3_47]|uniref:hypothetical protein n=1 Tax=Paenibacillus sp. PK3_47 TaxID=2072642 RepID=UPI00201D9279|nr:hypothetical protein [Paenibacillus sp. PK3_47]UQZ33153.1 hypothetical protein C2I18_06040 [Paenibacillus sp. PK3_47]
MKSVKSKVAVGVIVTGLMAGMGTAFASTDAGVQFKAWYSTVFNTASSKVTKDITSTYQAKLGSYNAEYEALKSSSVQSIKDSTEAKRIDTMKTINAAKNNYIYQVENAEKSTTVETDFAVFARGINEQVDAVKEGAKAYGETDLKNKLNAQGSASVTEINKQVASQQKSSTEDLTKKIKEAQDNINALVKQHSEAADKDIRSHIEAKIAELRAELTKYAADLTAAKQAEVAAAGDKAQAEALAALDAIAASIK